MAQVFPKGLNMLARLAVLGFPILAGSGAVGAAAFYRADYTTGARDVVEQPVPFSHRHHVSELGIDCRYCHTAVEQSYHAGYPPTKTCMNCHQQMWVSAELLAPVRDSYANDIPITWKMVHNLPHYTYFNHSIHIAKGVGCYSCHGRVDEMSLVFQTKTLLMEWCLDCHREPEKQLRPKSEVFNLTWHPANGTVDTDGEVIPPMSQAELGRKLKQKYEVRPDSVLTNCSICHR
jgi:hypothetical protein